MALPNPLTIADAQRIMREVIQDGAGRLEFANHLFDRQELRGITPRDVEKALVKGIVEREPIWNANYSNWQTRARVECDGTAITIGIAFEEGGGIRPLVILKVTTVW